MGELVPVVPEAAVTTGVLTAVAPPYLVRRVPHRLPQHRWVLHLTNDPAAARTVVVHTDWVHTARRRRGHNRRVEVCRRNLQYLRRALNDRVSQSVGEPGRRRGRSVARREESQPQHVRYKLMAQRYSPEAALAVRAEWRLV